MDFAHPWALLLVLAAPAAVGLYLLLAWSRRRAALRFAEASSLARLSNAEASPRLLVRALIIATAVACLAVAVAQPRWGSDQAEAVRRGSDVVIVLDTSLSMAARDVEPDRLGRARDEITSLVEQLQGDRVGLVIFAGESEVRFPLTDDDQAALAVISEVEVNPSLGEGSSIADGLEIAAGLLADSKTESRVIILVSDGENFGAEPLEIVQAARDDGISVFTVGVGTEEGTTIPVFDPEQDREVVKIDSVTGEPAITRMDPGRMQLLAELGGGHYYELSDRFSTVASPIASEISSLAQTNFSSRVAELPIERFQIFAVVAFLLLLLERLVPERALRLPRWRARRALVPVGVSLLALLVGACAASSFDASLRDGNGEFARGEYAAALEKYRDAQLADSNRAEADYNAANALYRLTQFDRAISEYLRALDVAEGGLVEDIRFNLGNAYFQLGRYDDAVAAYREALLLNPDHRDAKFNLELALNANQTTDAGDPGEGTAEPESNISPDDQGEGDTQEQDGDQGSDSENAEGGSQQEALEEAVNELGDEVSIEEALALLDQLEELEANEDSLDIDIIGTEDY
ncbi:MAG: VWA domain-containing protein [Dehalococcoidia bacterium]